MMNNTIAPTPTQRFWRLLQPDSAHIRNVYVYSIFSGLIGLSLPLGIQAIVNLIQGGQINTAWVVLVSIVVIGIMLTGILQVHQLKIVENLQQKIFSRAAFEFAHRIPRIRMEDLYRHHAPELMNRFFDVMSVQKGLPKILIDFSTAFMQILFGLIVLSFYHSFFVLFSLMLILLILLILRFTYGRGLATSLVESRQKYQVAHWLEELARTSLTFKLAGVTSLPLTRINNHVNDYLDARNNHFTILLNQYWLMILFKVMVAIGLLAIGGILVMEQQINIGQFVGAEIIVLLVMAAVEKLIISLETIYDTLTGLEKIGQITDMPLENHRGINLMEECTDQGLQVSLKNIQFIYPQGDKFILNKLSLDIAPGEKLLIIGPSGGGKSTLLQIIAGVFQIQEGEISYNNLPQSNLDLQSVRSVIGECLHQEQLFEGTLLENINTGRPDATFENVKWAVKNVGLTDFIKSLPEGFNTRIEPHGKTLPTSIVQKLLLARSIADKPKLLLLENVLESLEKEERQQIINFLCGESSWTIVALSRDHDFAQSVDRIAFMAEGKIINSGSYEELKNWITPKIN